MHITKKPLIISNKGTTKSSTADEMIPYRKILSRPASSKKIAVPITTAMLTTQYIALLVPTIIGSPMVIR